MIPPLPLPVTIELRATTLERAVPEFGRALGLPMRAAPAIGSEIVIASLHSVGAEELKTRLAETFAAEWSVDRDGTLVLDRSARFREAERRKSEGARAAMIDRGLSRVRGWLAQNLPITAEGYEIAKRRRDQPVDGPDGLPNPDYRTFEDPGWHLTWERLASLRASEFGGIGARTVFASRPNGRQRPLPIDAGAALRTYAENRRRWAEVTGRDLTPESTTALTLVAVENRAETIAMRVVRYDGSGAQIEARLVTIQAEDGSVIRTIENSDLEGPIAVAVSEPSYDGPKFRFAMPEASRGFAEIFGSGSSWSERARPPLDAYAPYLDVTARDPLSDVVMTLARETGRSVLMRGFDSAIGAGAAIARGGEIAPETALGTSAIDRTRPGWILIRSEDPYATSTTDFPRPALRDALRRGYDAPTFPVPVRIEVARPMPDSTRYVPLASMIERPGRANGTPNLYNAPNLRLLGALGGAAPHTIRLRDLTSEARTRLDAALYGASRWPLSLRGGSPTPVQTALLSEPTLLLPYGLPADGEVQVESGPSDLVFLPERGAVGERVNMAGFAFPRYPRAQPAFFGGEAVRSWGFERLVRVPRTRVVLRIVPLPGVAAETAFSSQDEPQGTPFSLDDLPADLRAAYDRASTEVERRDRDLLPNAGGGGTSAP